MVTGVGERAVPPWPRWSYRMTRQRSVKAGICGSHIDMLDESEFDSISTGAVSGPSRATQKRIPRTTTSRRVRSALCAISRLLYPRRVVELASGRIGTVCGCEKVRSREAGWVDRWWSGATVGAKRSRRI